MNYVDAIINGSGWTGGSGAGAAEAVLFTSQNLSAFQQAQARENIGGEAALKTVDVSGPDAVITPTDNTVYRCGALRSLTISDPPAAGAWSVVFTSGTAATTTTVPTSLRGLERFAAEPNALYEINVQDCRAAVGYWEVNA